jgi:membrane-bound lytic murein transglycosylase D
MPFRLLVAIATLLLAGCAATPSAKSARGGRVDESAVIAIQAEIDRAVTQGEEGIRRYRDGEPEVAADLFGQAREQLTAIAGRCVAMPGCEIERVLLAQDTLLDRQAQELLGRARVDAVDADDAGAPEGAGAGTIEHALPETSRTAALLQGRDLRKMVALNEPIRAALEEWLTWMRPNLMETYENYQYMRYKMFPAYERAGLPEALLFGILAKESGGKVHAVSRAGASGPLQFMYYTGARYGLGKDGGFDQRFDPALSASANVAYLNDQLRLLNNDLELVLGAYNGGEGRMQRLSPHGRSRFWDPKVQGRLPPETREYVPMVLAAAWLFMHPAEYGVEFPAIDGRPARITLAQPLSLNELSICLGQGGTPRGWFRTVRNLNPRHDPNLRLPAGTMLELPVAAAAAYEATCKGGPLLAMSQQLHEARDPVVPAAARVAQSGNTHVVRRGETLSSIARRYGCPTVKPIAAANQIKPPRYAIRAGQKLSVPSCRA